jgi:hypothetical protein
MNKQDRKLIAQAKQAALKILLHNNSGNFENLPRVQAGAIRSLIREI